MAQQVIEPLGVLGPFAVARHLDERIEGVELVLLERVCELELAESSAHRTLVHELNRLQDVTQLKLSLLEELEDILEGAAADHAEVLETGEGRTEDRTLSNRALKQSYSQGRLTRVPSAPMNRCLMS